MKKYEEKEVIKKEKVLKSISCDTCKSVIEKGIYYEVMTGHGRWGNDSVESINHYDFCSYKCMKQHMDIYFTFEEGYSSRYEIEIEER